jgi:PAS domain S-box-containing protein
LALQGILEGIDATLVTAGSGEEALRWLARNDAAVILLDVAMPTLDGFETAKLIRLRPGSRTTPIIFVTAVAQADAQRLSGYHVGAVDYLIKPLIADMVQSKVAVFIELSRQKKELERLVNETKRTAAALNASELEYRRLFESAQEGILILDAESGQLNDANQYLIDLFGYSKEELLQKKLWEIGLFADIENCKKGFMKLQQEGFFRYDDLTMATKDGRSVDVEFVCNMYPVGDQNRIQCNIRDITERVRADASSRAQQIQIVKLNNELEQRVKDRTGELEAANKELEAFAYSVSHDLRAPLRAIDGFVHLLQDSAEIPSEKRQHYLQMLIDNARQMSQLIDDLLRFSRSNRQTVQLQTIAPNEVIRL